jgi:hypothetical protein
MPKPFERSVNSIVARRLRSLYRRVFRSRSGVGPLVVRIAVRLTGAYQFDADSRTRSNSGSDGIYSSDSGEPTWKSATVGGVIASLVEIATP